MDRCHRIDAAHGTALVRLSGRGDANLGRAALVVLAGETVHRFQAMPEPSPGDGWRMAFGVPADVLDRARAFALDLDEGVIPIVTPAWVATSQPAAEREPATERSPEGMDPRRLVALELMLSGRDRDDVEEHLKGQFGPEAAQAIAADVYRDR